MERGIPMGTSPGGADWCVKALHPSDPQTEVRGIPDRSAVPSLLMNYQSTFTLSPTVGATGTWQFDASLLPHPIDFMYVDLVDSTTTGKELNFLNTQLTGATHIEKYLTFIGMVQRWRLAYMSVTVYQDGPDLANQGSIVVAQVPTEPLTSNFAGPNIVAGDGTLCAAPTIELYTPEDRPNFIVSQGMPNAYFARSREGAYVPLKLTETCQRWVSDRDRVGTAQMTPVTPQNQTNGFYALPATGTIPGFPHVTLSPSYYSVTPVRSYGQFTSPMLNGTWANISARNLAIATSYTFFVRCGIEMQVQPQSNLAPQLQISPPYDPVALDAYFAIARELKDGYPADYNDLGKIWDAISSAAHKVLPTLGKIPGFKIPATMMQGVVGAGDFMRNASKGTPKKKKGGGKKKTPRATPRKKKPQAAVGARAEAAKRNVEKR